MLRIPNPVTYPCANCGESAVLVEFPTGLHPVHCGTYREECTPSRPGRSTVSSPPDTRPRARRWLGRFTR
jgi:hypothetical protein